MTATEQAPAFEGVAKPLAGIRKIAARRMVEAWAAPVFHLSVNVDMSAVLAANLKAVGATVTDAILHASASALVAQPGMNAHFADNLVTTFTERWNTGAAQASTIRRAAILRMPASGLATPSKAGACSVAVTSAVLLK